MCSKKLVFLYTVLFLGVCDSNRVLENNVCTNILDYKNMRNGLSCYYNPDIDTTPDQIARNHGMDFQNHKIVTKDGYFLNLYRIRNNPFSFTTRPVILLHHGIFSSALGFMITGKRSLAFFLAGRGFDVWLLNNRGSSYSNGHLFLNQSDPKFWDVSFEEFGNFDVPASIEHIYTQTNQKIIYLGHSMGSMSSFVYSSRQRRHAEKYLNGIIAISPVASLTHYINPLKIKPAIHKFRLLINKLRGIGIHSLFDNQESRRYVFRNLCRSYPFVEFCRIVMFLLLGWNRNDSLAEDIPAIISYHPARCASKTLLHGLQIADVRRFQNFDYGPTINLEKYNSTDPPMYRLEDITVPVHLFYGENDDIAGKDDSELIFRTLKSSRKSITGIPIHGDVKYNHIDFLFGKTVETNFYPLLLDVLHDLLI